MTGESENERRSGRGRRRSDSESGVGRSRRSAPGGRGAVDASQALASVQAAFFACGRCSYFLTGYRALHGQDVIAAAAENNERWLTLPWSAQTRQLLHETLGGRIDLAADYYMIACPDCTRAYLYQAEEGAEATFQVEIKPRARH